MSLKSLRTRMRGLTAWINVRLVPYNVQLSNVLVELLTGSTLKCLLLSVTGRDLERFGSFDEMSQQQRMTRVQWMVDEMKKRGALPQDFGVNVRQFVLRNADEVFALLSSLVRHDIHFLWERVEFLRHTDEQVLCQATFSWIPEPVPPVQKKNVVVAKSLLSGLGKATVLAKVVDDQASSNSANYVPFPDAEIMTKFHTSSPAGPSTAHTCLLRMIREQLETTSEGRRLHVKNLSGLADGRVVCALVNCFVPHALPTELLLNGRWTINTALRAAERMFHMPTSSVDSQDLVEANSESVCAYFCAFLLHAYKFRQCDVVARKFARLQSVQRETNIDLSELTSAISADDAEDSSDVRKLRLDLMDVDRELAQLMVKFDVKTCVEWSQHVEHCVRQLHQHIRAQMTHQFHVITLPYNSTVKNLCQKTALNLSLTDGSGFYLTQYRENAADGRKILLWDMSSKQFIGRKLSVVQRLLGISATNTEFVPAAFPRYHIYVELMSANKLLKSGEKFLYRVFPGSWKVWLKTLRGRVVDNDVEAVDRMTRLLQHDDAVTFIGSPCSGKSGDTVLHLAARRGHLDIVLCLLERGADVDAVNSRGETALFGACEAGQQCIAQLLVEWGCDVNVISSCGLTAVQSARAPQLAEQLTELHLHYSTCVPRIADGDVEVLERLVQDHISGARRLVSARSRCINGSTLLHAAAYFGHVKLARQVLRLPGADLDMVDDRGASVLHRARGADAVRYLIDARATVDALDHQGNTALHVKSYGDCGQKSDVDGIQQLVNAGARLDTQNERRLTPLHCAAMQGRVDVLEILLAADADRRVVSTLAADPSPKPLSLVYLAVANDCIECARWLLAREFQFKVGEQDRLLLRLLSEQLTVSDRVDVMRLLLQHGADANARIAEGSVLHYAAGLPNTEPAVLELLLTFGAQLDARDADGETALFAACRADRKVTAALLLTHGADINALNLDSLSAFDVIADHEDWIVSGLFDQQTVTQLRACTLRHARQLVRQIATKVRPACVSGASTSSQSDLLQRRIETIAAEDAVKTSNAISLWHRPRRRETIHTYMCPA